MRYSIVFSAVACLAPQAIMASLVEASHLNIRSTEPSAPIYPQKAAGDAPYSQDETVLRAAIKMPTSFTFGQKKAIILTPGTGVTGTQTFTGNFMKQIAATSDMEPVTLDIPDNLLDDAQTNSEFVAYAINYVSGVSNNASVGVVSWSQGGLNTQWAVKYYPSTRPTVSDFVAVSPDLKGTTVANLFGGPPPTSILPLAPALYQQINNSKFVAALRSNGGDSAIVPTTSLWSSTDEIVMPQPATSDASSWFNDANGAGASNTQVQAACPNQPAGGNFTHEGMLYNPVTFALAMDAFRNPGPGQLSRIDLATVCQQSLAPGLTATDKSTTDATIEEAAANILVYSKPATGEPAIRPFATTMVARKRNNVAKRNFQA